MTNKSEKEKTARRKVLKNLVDLRNDHKVASILIWITSWGTSYFGTEGLKEKAKRAFDCKCACTCEAANGNLWADVMEEDDLKLSKAEICFDPGMDLLDYMNLDTQIEKLPMRLDLMVLNDLSKWLRPQIIRSRHERGFTGTKIGYKDPMWCPTFWPSDMCDWTEVPNFKHWKAAEYKGEGGITGVLRKAVENRLAEKNLDPSYHIKVNVDKNKQKRTEKWRGHHSDPEVSKCMRNCFEFNDKSSLG